MRNGYQPVDNFTVPPLPPTSGSNITPSHITDFVDVVRCKNCKHSYYDNELEKYWCTNYSGSIEKSADGFCDDGKPRSE